MAPQPEPQERPKRRIADKHKKNQNNVKARKGSRKKAKRADSDSDNDDTQPWVNDPKGFKAIGQTFQLSYITDDESDKNMQAVVVASIYGRMKKPISNSTVLIMSSPARERQLRLILRLLKMSILPYGLRSRNSVTLIILSPVSIRIHIKNV